MIATTARRRRKVVIPTPPVTAQAQRAAERLKSANEPKPYTPSAEFQRAYSGPEVGPVGASWPADETGYSRYMVWRLPVSSGSNRPTPPRN
jgi:hypothetical protein